MRIRWNWLSLLILATSINFATAQDVSIKAVYIKDNDVFIISSHGGTRRLTYNGIPKSDPLWSLDGSRVAFLRKIDPGIALGNLVVIDLKEETTTSNIFIRPVKPGIMDPIHYIDRVQWLTPSRIAIAGSINLSTEDTVVYDAETGAEVTDYTDDTGGAVFSPDGEHAAAENGSPHWTPADDADPELDIDNQRIYPPRGARIRFLSKPAWSENSKEIAVIAENRQSGKRSVVICQLNGICKITILPVSGPAPTNGFQVSWSGSRVYVTAPKGTWSCQHGDTLAAQSPPLPNPKAAAKILTSHLRDQIREAGGKQPNFWCSKCVLANLPRQAPRSW